MRYFPTLAKHKITLGWVLYDWANSAFSTTVMAGFFPIFFKRYWSFGVDANLSSARLGFGISLASLTLALLAPVLGAISDQAGTRKRMMTIFAGFGIFMCGLLYWVPKGHWEMAILIYCLAIIGFYGSILFYDSLICGIVEINRREWISSVGYAVGYLGGGLIFAMNVAWTLYPQVFSIASATEAVRLSFLSVALWWGGFGLLTLLWVPEQAALAKPGQNPVQRGLRQLKDTAKRITKDKPVMYFLIAYWLYIDGVDTMIVMAVDYGLSLGLQSTDLIIALLITQFIGFPSALVFGKIGIRLGEKKGIFIAIFVYAFVCLWAMGMKTAGEFYVLAAVIGLVQGGIQALSRSMYSKLIPQQQSGEFFGFYNMIGKFAAILGPALMAVVILTSRGYFETGLGYGVAKASEFATRASIASIILLFGLGAFFLTKVKAPVSTPSSPLQG